MGTYVKTNIGQAGKEFEILFDTMH